MEGEPINGFKVPQQFDIEAQFDHYLLLVKLDKRKVLPFQMREMRRAFYGAWGMKMISDRDQLTLFSEDDAVEILENQLDQVATFWNKEIVPGVFNEN